MINFLEHGVELILPYVISVLEILQGSAQNTAIKRRNTVE